MKRGSSCVCRHGPLYPLCVVIVSLYHCSVPPSTDCKSLETRWCPGAACGGPKDPTENHTLHMALVADCRSYWCPPLWYSAPPPPLATAHSERTHATHRPLSHSVAPEATCDVGQARARVEVARSAILHSHPRSRHRRPPVLQLYSTDPIPLSSPLPITMPVIPPGSLVLVTGASGFVAVCAITPRLPIVPH